MICIECGDEIRYGKDLAQTKETKKYQRCLECSYELKTGIIIPAMLTISSGTPHNRYYDDESWGGWSNIVRAYEDDR